MERKTEKSNWLETHFKLTMNEMIVLSRAMTAGISNYMENKKLIAQVDKKV